MFKIGDFSKLTRVSTKMLRHYADIGLLAPAHVDRDTGYRYYSATQLPRLNRIIALKDLGFRLDQINDFLDDDLSLEQMRGMLKLRHAEISANLAADQQRLQAVEMRLGQLSEAATPQLPRYDVVLRAVPPVLMATIRRTVPSLGHPIKTMFDIAEDYVGKQNARAFASPLTIFHDEDYQEADLDVEVGIPITKMIPDHEDITIKEIEGAEQMACVIYAGGYDKTADALHAIAQWAESHHFTLGGAIREVYIRFGADPHLNAIHQAFLAHDSKAYVTEIQVPLKITD